MRSIRVCRTPGAFTPEMDRGWGYWPRPHNTFARIDPADITGHSDGQQVNYVPVQYPWSEWSYLGDVEGWFSNPEPLYRENVWFGCPGLEFNEDRRLVLKFMLGGDETRPWFQVLAYIPIGGLRGNGCRLWNSECEAHDGTLDLNTAAGNFTDVVTLDVPNVVGVGNCGWSDWTTGLQDLPSLYVITKDLEIKSTSDVDQFDNNYFETLGQSSGGGLGWSDKWQLLEYVFYSPNPDGAYQLMGTEFGGWGKMIVDYYRRKWSAW